MGRDTYTEHQGDFPGTYWLAGTDKPHRCPACWSCSWRYAKFWRLRKRLPRQCQNCGAVTLTVRLCGGYGKQVR